MVTTSHTRGAYSLKYSLARALNESSPIVLAANSRATMPPSRRIFSFGASAVSFSHCSSLLWSYWAIILPSMEQNWAQVTGMSESPASSGKKPYQTARSLPLVCRHFRGDLNGCLLCSIRDTRRLLSVAGRKRKKQYSSQNY